MSSQQRVHLGPEDMDRIYAIVEKVSREISMRAVDSTLISLGIDPKNPIEAQKDMSALREIRLMHSDPDFQADMIHLRSWRKNMEQVRSRGTIALMSLSGCGLLGFAAFALNNKLF